MTFTFYSYKGGVGRSMALANVASWFHLQGARVVMIDWDLEAPGLEAFFYQDEQALDAVRAKPGLMDLLLAYRQHYASAARTLDSPRAGDLHRAAVASLAPIDQWLSAVHAPESAGGRAAGLWLLSAGARHGRFADYAESVHDFDWPEFYADYEGEAFFEWLRGELAPEFSADQLVRQAHADVVLIDSRTGITEMGGVCTQQLADVVVAFSAPNLQNLLGVATMARSFRREEILESRHGKPAVIIVPSRVDASELESRNRFETRLHEIESEFIPPVLQSLKRTFWDLKIPYVPKFAYEEALAIRSGSSDARHIEAEEMASAYRMLGATLVMLTPASHPVRSLAAQATTSLFDRKRVYVTWAGLTGTSLANAIVRKFEANAPDIDLWLQQRASSVPVSDAPLAPDVLLSSTFLVAVSPEALESDWIRREWQRARRNGTCIYGVYSTALPSILPRWMRRARFFEINDEWNHLLQVLRGPCLALRAPFMAPDLPAPYVERPQPLALLRRAVLGPSGDPVPGPVVVRGIGGSGKSALAAAFCHDPSVMAAFDDGILWVTLGPAPQVRESLTQLYAAITGERPAFANGEDASFHLGAKISALQCLIVLDDVHSPEDAKPFLQAGPHATWLITSRSIAAAPDAIGVPLDYMTLEESVQMLVGALEVSYTPLSLRTVATELGGHPLALAIARSLLFERVQQGDSVERASAHLLEQLKRNGLGEFPTIREVVDATLLRLTAEARTRFSLLKSLDGDRVKMSEAAALWGVDEFDAESQVQQFARLSLVAFDPMSATLAIPALIRSYLRTQKEPPRTSRASDGLSEKQIRALAEEMERLLADRERFKNLPPVVQKIEGRIAEIEALLQHEQ